MEKPLDPTQIAGTNGESVSIGHRLAAFLVQLEQLGARLGAL